MVYETQLALRQDKPWIRVLDRPQLLCKILSHSVAAIRDHDVMIFPRMDGHLNHAVALTPAHEHDSGTSAEVGSGMKLSPTGATVLRAGHVR